MGSYLGEVGYWVHEIGFSSIRNHPKYVFKRQVFQGYSSFLFCHSYLMIFQNFAEPLSCSTLKNHQTCQKFGQK